MNTFLLSFTAIMVLLVLPANSYSNSNEQGDTPQSSITVPDAARKNELTYIVQQDCGSCHGMTLKGGLGPSLLPERMAALPKQYLINAVTHGRQETPMPPWGPLLTAGEIQWIVEQLQLGQLGQTNQ